MKLRKLLVLLMLVAFALVLSACGAQGEKGPQGPQGDKGDTGATGATGDKGDQGEVGDEGEAGADGVGIEFSFTSEGLAWRYVGSKTWNVGVEYSAIFTAMEEAGVGEMVKATGFDYIVDDDYAEYTAGAQLTAYEKELTFGTNAFATLEDAVAAAKVEEAKEGYEGLVIYVAKGQYDGCTIDVSKLTFYGPNNGKLGQGERIPEAEVITRVEVIADEVAFVGMKFTETAAIVLGRLAVEGENAADAIPVSKFAVQYSYLDATGVSPANNNRSGVITNEAPVQNIIIADNYIEATGYCKACIDFGVTSEDVYILRNYLAGYLEGSSGQICESIIVYNAGGEYVIDNNTLELVTDNWCIYFVNSPTLVKADITNNVFMGAKDDNPDKYNCGSYIAGTPEGSVVNFIGNAYRNTQYSTYRFAGSATVNILYNSYDYNSDLKFSPLGGVTLNIGKLYVEKPERIIPTANYTFGGADAETSDEGKAAKIAEWQTSVGNYSSLAALQEAYAAYVPE